MTSPKIRKPLSAASLATPVAILIAIVAACAPAVTPEPAAPAAPTADDDGASDGALAPTSTNEAPAAAPDRSSTADAASVASPAPVASASASSAEGDGVAPADGKASPDESGACPAGMKLVEGDYCPKVEHKCLKEWYAPQNKKRVCEEFEKGHAKCIGTPVKKRYCIDTYSWPNETGARPEVMNRFYQAQMKCAAVGKRLCTESEWDLACEGPDRKPFPYGWVRDANKCNGDHKWDGPNMKKVARRDPKELARLWKGVRSGSQPDCISDYGVADLPANNDEIVANEHHKGRKAKFESVHTGGPWYKGVRNQCRPKIYTHDEGFYYYFLGFRCCAEPDGKPTDPRTPWQRRKAKRGKRVWQLDRPKGKRAWRDVMEGMSGWKWDELKMRLEKKKTDPTCGCDEVRGRNSTIRCKTMCGTLLGPGAKDGR